METIFFYAQLYIKYIEQTHPEITEEDIEEEIKKLDGKGAVTMSILERREEKGRQEGRQEGIELGKKERDIEIAKNLLRNGSEVAFISKVTGLSISEVEDLKAKINN